MSKPTQMPTTFDLLPFPMTAHELEEKLHAICDAVGCWDWQVCYDPEFNRLYLKPERN